MFEAKFYPTNAADYFSQVVYKGEVIIPNMLGLHIEACVDLLEKDSWVNSVDLSLQAELVDDMLTFVSSADFDGPLDPDDEENHLYTEYGLTLRLSRSKHLGKDTIVLNFIASSSDGVESYKSETFATSGIIQICKLGALYGD